MVESVSMCMERACIVVVFPAACTLFEPSAASFPFLNDGKANGMPPGPKGIGKGATPPSMQIDIIASLPNYFWDSQIYKYQCASMSTNGHPLQLRDNPRSQRHDLPNSVDSQRDPFSDPFRHSQRSSVGRRCLSPSVITSAVAVTGMSDPRARCSSSSRRRSSTSGESNNHDQITT
jgi:hypothetical protein